MRISVVLKEYDQYGNKSETPIQTLNDYLHILQNHDADAEFEYIANAMGYCDINNCNAYKRNNHLLPRVDVTSDILDKCHCYMTHSYDIGYRLTSSEKNLIYSRLQQNEEKMR